MDISIPTTSISNAPKPYTLYTISIRLPLRSFTISKRFSDFLTLHTSVVAQCNGIAPPAGLPHKSWFKSTTSSPALMESRRRGLEAYLQAINEASDPTWRSCSAWRTFLSLGSVNPLASNSTPTAAKRAPNSHTAITDPNIWLDVYRDLKTQLRDARSFLAKRDQANTAQAQHEAGVSAKSCLVRSGTMLLSLEQGLETMSTKPAAQGVSKRRHDQDDRVDGGPQLGGGEFRRRHDLLTTEKKVRDALEELSNSLTARSNAETTGFALASKSDKESLFKDANNSRASASRRVLGAPLKETERTRELDNAGVLQLQQQIMQQQETDVEDLSKVVRRMREMGVQISEELVYQNKMLGMLDQDVDRVQDKVDIAKKRVGKIK